MKLKQLFESTTTSRDSKEPNMRETVTQLNNELCIIAETNSITEEWNRHLQDKVMTLSEQLSGVQNTLSEWSQQASGSGSHPPISLRHRRHRHSTYAPLPQPQCQDDDDDGGGSGNGDSDGDNHGYDLHSSYNYFNY